jgi:hypothetical protein
LRWIGAKGPIHWDRAARRRIFDATGAYDAVWIIALGDAVLEFCGGFLREGEGDDVLGFDVR